MDQSGVFAYPGLYPDRTAFLPDRSGEAFLGPGTTALSASEFTLPEAFAAGASGYSVAQFGKWHLSNGVNSPSTVGAWPHFSGPLQGAIPDYYNWTKVTNGVSQTVTTYATTEIVNDAISWIAARGSQPWFVWLAFNAPHTPLHKPPNSLHSYDSLPGTQVSINNNPRSYYEAAVEAADTEIGRLLAAVDRSKTDIILLGDNGTPANTIQPPHPSSHAKDTLYDGGIRVPFLINGPSVVHPGRVNSSLVHAVDLYATILELAGTSTAATVPSSIPVDSRSLLPLIRDETETEPRWICSELFGSSIQSVDGGQTLRNDRYKFIRFVDGREEFYDLQSDPGESANLAAVTLTADQQANFNSLRLRLANFQDDIPAPAVQSTTLTSGQFRVTVNRDTSLTYSLWRSADLSELSWSEVTGTIVSDTATVTLTDPAPSSSRRFYRVLGEK